MRFALPLLAWFVATAGVANAAHESAPADTVRPPAPQAYSYVYDIADNSLIRPATRMLDVAHVIRLVTRQPREAANVDTQDQVRLPSTWWQPRLGFRQMTVEQMLTGPGPGTGPAPGPWKVTHTKDQGVTPGFQITDSEGARFLVKFDDPGSPELATGAEVIGSRLFWAAGYNVPDDAISHFRLEDLVIGKDAVHTDAHGHKRAMTLEDVKQILAGVARAPDGSYRCVTSRYLPGKPLGPFEYFGRRRDDPEDRIPHELRRELRGMWAMCAWVNHADSRGPNSLDTWIDAGGRSFVRHHLIDFSAVLGAGPAGPRAYPTGSEFYVDFGVMGREGITAGLKPFAWEHSVDPKIPAVGFVEAATFNPEHWRPDYPNPAFDERTARDTRWGVRIVAGFSDEMIRAAVARAQYTDPRATEYLVRTLIERRDKLVHEWLRSESPPTIVVR